MSPRIDPPYPSFALVLSKAANSVHPTSPPTSIVIRNNAHASNAPQSSTLRLPAYRAAHIGRYHPYPKVASRRGDDRLMSTVDYRYAEEPLWEDAGIDSSGEAGTANEENAEGDAVVASPEINVHPSVDTQSATIQPPPPVSALSKTKLVLLFADMIVALRRRYLSAQAAKHFFEAQQLKK
ncbi:hypothetical protein BN946_scf184785.g21 [Trametes cinnabarina]|uniref:Uncharacterized protein n=1 Tax=Pycnoporus cinnabarinus TaxID=5643 RepID=A0A060S5P2_PYCCI|nr:hypothetical protein BN946_scf184785.g21 [Trametes cinnabarina]